MPYRIMNAANPTTAAPATVATGAAIKTMLQALPGVPIRIIEWGYSFSSAVAVGTIELLDTGAVVATVTAYAAGDVSPVGGSEPANTAGTGGLPLNLGTAQSGFTGSAEGTITVTRGLDVHRITPNPNLPIWRQFVLRDEPGLPIGKVGRIRVTMTADVNMFVYLIFRVGE